MQNTLNCNKRNKMIAITVDDTSNQGTDYLRFLADWKLEKNISLFAAININEIRPSAPNPQKPVIP